MAKLRLKTAFQYCLRDGLTTIAIFFGIMVAVHAALAIAILIFARPGSTMGNISLYESAAMITLFVTGIVAVRENLRLLIQHGIGRRTAFISQIGVAATLSLIAALAGGVLIGVSQTLLSGSLQIQYLSFYQMTFNSGQIAAGWGAHLIAAALGFAVYFTGYLLGMLVSLIFYRLPKPWKVVVAAGVPVFFVLIVPLSVATSAGKAIFSWLAEPLARLIDFAFRAPGNYLGVSLLFAILVACFCFLLMRRAPIR
ncbi:MAG: hypothetical protein GX572_00700 [Clostridia bacterium]|nr:hypothetical protein [Clostridia bacterium]